MVGPVDAALGVRAVTLTLLNCGSAAYAVSGYPGLRLLDQERSAIDVQVSQEPDPVARSAPAPGPFSLVPGARAQAVVLWRNTVELGSDPTPGAYLCVRPAPSEAEQALPLDVDLGTTGRLTAGPWRPVP